MHFQQVFTLALAFSSDRGASVFTAPCDAYYGRILSLAPPLSSSRVLIEEDRLAPGNEWHVRIVGRGTLLPPIYFPPAHSPEDLESTLREAWAILDQPSPPPHWHLTRSVEEPDLAPATASQPQSASPRLRRTHSMIQMPPRRE